MNRASRIFERRLRRCAATIFALAIAPVLLLVGIELCLRTAGYGISGSPFRVVQDKGKRYYIGNKNYLYAMFSSDLNLGQSFQEIVIPEDKETNTYRIFVFGSSAAQGWVHECSFAQLLQVMLMRTFPGIRFEVFNLAAGGVNSSIMRPLAKECSKMNPDAYVIYMGNNEVHGPYGLATGYQMRTGRILNPLEIRIHQNLNRLRLVQLIRQSTRWNTEAAAEKNHSYTLRRDDRRFARIWRNYEYNLRDMFESAAAAKASVFISSLAANVRHWPPQTDLLWEDINEEQKQLFEQRMEEGIRLERKNQWQDALNSYAKAYEICDASPYLSFRRANCFWALADFDTAKKLYYDAVEMDSFAWVRAKNDFNRTLLNAVENSALDSVFFVDGKAAFEDVAAHGVPGNESFVDSCHFRPTGMYILAKKIYEIIVPHLPEWVKKRKDISAQIPDMNSILELLGYSSILREDILEHLLKKSEESGLAAAEDLKTELTYTRQHPHIPNLSAQLALLEEYIEAKVEDLLIARKYLDCLIALPERMTSDRKSHVKNLANRYPFDPTIQHYHAQILLRDTNPADTIECTYETLLKAYPQDGSAYINLMTLYVKRKALYEAERLLIKATRNKIDQNTLLHLQGEVFRISGDYRSVDCYVKAAGRNSKTVGNAIEALLEYVKEYPEEAGRNVCHLSRAVENLYSLHGNNELVKVLEALGAHFHHHGNFKEAVAQYTAALSLNPNNLMLQHTLADSIEMLEHPPAVLETYKNLLFSNPELAGICARLDSFCKKYGDTQATLEMWRSIVKVLPNAIMPQFYLATTLFDLGAYESSSIVLEALSKSSPLNTLISFHLGKSLLFGTDMERGLHLLRHIITIDPGLASSAGAAIAARAFLAEKRGEYELASRLYTFAVEAAPTDLWNKVSLGQLFETMRRDDEAMSLYQEVLEAAPESPITAALLDALQERRQDWEKAEIFWRHLSEAYPETSTPMYHLGLCRERVNSVAEAQDAYQNVLDINPNHGQALYRLSALEILQGQVDKGLAQIKQAVLLEPGLSSSVSKRLDEIAARQAENQEYESALRLYNVALEITPEDLWHAVHLGDMYEKLGHIQEALDVYRDILLKKPESPVTAQKMDDLLKAMHKPLSAILTEWEFLCEQHPNSKVLSQYLAKAQEAVDE